MSDRMPRASGYFRTDYAQEIALIKTRLERASLIVLVALLIAFPFVASAFYLDLATQVFLASIGSLSLAGMFSFRAKRGDSPSGQATPLKRGIRSCIFRSVKWELARQSAAD